MARMTRAEYLRYAGRAVMEAIVSLASGKNPDGTDYTLPVEGTITQGTAGAEPWPVAPNISRNAGAVDANTQRVVLASDGPTVTALGTPSAAAYTGSGDTNMVGGLKGLFARLALWVFDSTDRARVSLYGKSSAAGDMPLLTDALGNLKNVLVRSSDGVAITASGAGDAVTPGILLSTAAYAALFNGATMDRQRNNQDLTLLVSAARTIATNSADIVAYNARYLRVDIDISAVAGSPSLIFRIKAKDVLSGVYSTILETAALVGTGHTVLLIGPGLLAAANAVANAPLSRTFRVEVAAGTADSVTYSIGASLSV